MTRRTVQDVMTRGVVSAYRGALFKDIVRVMVERGVTAVPVIDQGHRVAASSPSPTCSSRRNTRNR